MRTLFTLSLVLLAGCPGNTPTDDEPTPTDPANCTELLAEDIEGGGTLDGCYTVPSGLYLTGDVVIEAGSELTFAPGTRLEVGPSGSLETRGTEDEPVVLQGEAGADGAWTGVGFSDSGAPTNRLEHTTIAGACEDLWNGANDSWGAIFADGNSRLTLTNVSISGCPETGLQTYEDVDLTVDGLAVDGAAIPVRIAAEQAAGLGGVLTLTGDDPTVHLTDPWVESPLTLPVLDYTAEEGLGVSGGDLVVQAGTTVAFETDTGLDVLAGGSLNAVGTASAPIAFVGVDDVDGAWLGVHFEASNSAENVLEYVTIDGGGSDLWHGGDRSKAGLYLEGDEVRLDADHLTISRCEGPGITIDAKDPAGKIAIHTATLSGCDEGARVTPDAVGALVGPLTLEGNDTDRLRVSEMVPSGRVASEDITWLDHGVPWFVDVVVMITGDVTLDAGTELVFDDDMGITVGDSITTPGTLTVGASGGDPVLLRGESAVSGFWRGLQIYGSAANQITNTTISHAGSSQWDGSSESQAGLHISGGGSVALTDVTLTDIEVQDIYVADGSVTGCTGVTANITGDPDATWCTP